MFCTEGHAAWCAGGMVPPLYIHKTAHSNQASQLSEASFEAEWMHRVAAVSRSQVWTALRPCLGVLAFGILGFMHEM